MSEDLKPCPYCGGEGVVGYSYADITDNICDWFLGATNINPTHGYCTEKEAIKAWNTQTEPEDFLKEIYDWAFYGMEGCDEPEWSLFTGITGVIAKYWRETSLPSHTPNDYDDIEF